MPIMLSVRRNLNDVNQIKQQQQRKMPENLSPVEGAAAAAEQVEDLRRNNNNGGYSPHSTTGTPSREPRTAEEETTTPEEESRGATGSDSPSSSLLKQILAATIKLSGSISRQHSERTLQIVTDLLIGTIDSAEFQLRVAQLIHLPFRPLVAPLMDKQLPWLRREMAGRLHQSVRQTTSQPSVSTMKEHVKVLLALHNQSQESSSSSSSDHSSVLSVWQVFQPGGPTVESSASVAASPNTRKRRASASLVENSSGSSSDGGGAMEETGNKRSSVGWSNPGLWMPPKVNFLSGQQLQQPSRQLVTEMSSTPKTSTTTTTTWSSFSSSSYPAPFQQQSPQGDEEWANIHTMLNCILSMVEKTRRALGILQQRSNDNQQQQKRRDSPSALSLQQHQVYEASELRRQAGELIAQTLKATEDRVSQVKRKAEEAVHDVRRAAMVELQRALSAERVRAERLAAEARRQGAEEALSALGQHAIGGGNQPLPISTNKEVCWNCGRRANETCSGCNVARYCSTFCQHKHWEVHHKICGRVSQLMLAAAAAAGSAPSSASVDHHRSELAVGGRPSSPSSSHIGRSNGSSSKTPSPVQQNTSGSASYVH